MRLTDPAKRPTPRLLAAPPFLLVSRMDSLVGQPFSLQVTYHQRPVPEPPSTAGELGAEGLVKYAGDWRRGACFKPVGASASSDVCVDVRRQHGPGHQGELRLRRGLHAPSRDLPPELHFFPDGNTDVHITRYATFETCNGSSATAGITCKARARMRHCWNGGGADVKEGPPVHASSWQ
jgi:hypothetical protein